MRKCAFMVIQVQRAAEESREKRHEIRHSEVFSYTNRVNALVIATKQTYKNIVVSLQLKNKTNVKWHFQSGPALSLKTHHCVRCYLLFRTSERMLRPCGENLPWGAIEVRYFIQGHFDWDWDQTTDLHNGHLQSHRLINCSVKGELCSCTDPDAVKLQCHWRTHASLGLQCYLMAMQAATGDSSKYSPFTSVPFSASLLISL